MRIGIGKKVGPFHVGVSFGGGTKKSKSKKPKPNLDYTMTRSKKPPTPPEKRIYNRPLFWWILCELFAVSSISGIVQLVQKGLSAGEIFAIVIVIGLAAFFAYMAITKQKKFISASQNTENSHTVNLNYSEDLKIKNEEK